MRNYLLSLALTFFMGSIAYAQEIKTIHFATEATYPPFESINENGEMQGFDIAIAKAICVELKATCQFSNQAFSSLIPSLQVGKYDALIAALGVTPQRQQQVDFSDSYYEPSAAFVAELNKHYTLKDLNEKIVGVQAGSTMEAYLKAKYPTEIERKTYASIQDAFLDLTSGRIDLVLADTPIANTWLEENNNIANYGIVGAPIVDHQYFGAGYAIAVRKGNKDLLQAINTALAKIKADGTYNKLLKHYTGQ